jgi:hypothetical protein
MDPYLESHWGDVHAGLIVYGCDALQPLLPKSLRSRIDGTESLDVACLPGRFIKIIDIESGNRVVTVIEFLSPSNKLPGRNRDQYERKQREICSSDSNLVEIDLNRFGTHVLAFPLGNLKKSGRTPYMASVRRPGGLAEVYAMPLRERLRTIKVPLRPTDAEVPLDLQPLIDLCYRNGGYEGTLDYSVDPEPPLVGADKEWAEAMLIEKGLRSAKKSSQRKRRPK